MSYNKGCGAKVVHVCDMRCFLDTARTGYHCTGHWQRIQCRHRADRRHSPGIHGNIRSNCGHPDYVLLRQCQMRSIPTLLGAERPFGSGATLWQIFGIDNESGTGRK